jgi:tetratricopeptide (TPR) repeat protein
LYTREYYELCRNHLASQGIMAQWIPMHGLPRREYERVLATFSSIFPYCELFAVPRHSIVLGSLSPIRAARMELEARLANPRVKASLKGARFSDLAELMSTYVCGTARIRSRVGDLAVNCDDLAYTAFSESSDAEEDAALEKNLTRVLAMQDPWGPQLPVDISQSEWEKGISDRTRLFEAFLLSWRGLKAEALDAVAQLHRERPAYGAADYFFSKLTAERTRYFSGLVAGDMQEGIRLARAKQYSEAAVCFEKVLKVWPDSAAANFYYAGCLMELKRYDKAEFHAAQAASLEPDNSEFHSLLLGIRGVRSSATRGSQ